MGASPTIFELPCSFNNECPDHFDWVNLVENNKTCPEMEMDVKTLLLCLLDD
jgi:hypothetical protein